MFIYEIYTVQIRNLNSDMAKVVKAGALKLKPI